MSVYSRLWRSAMVCLAVAGLCGVVGCVDGYVGGDGEPEPGTGECPGTGWCNGARLEVTADVVTFSNRDGASRVSGLRLSNAGDIAFRITALSLSGATPGAFAFRLRERDELVDRLEPDLLVRPGDELGIEVTYSGEHFGRDLAVLEIASTALLGNFPIGLLTLNEAQRVLFQPLELDFGSVPAGSLKREVVSLLNQGELDASVDDIELRGSTEFKLTGLPELPAIVAPGESLPLYVTYRPVMPFEGASATIVAMVSDPGGRPLEQVPEVELRGIAGNPIDNCAQAVALGVQVTDGQGTPVDDPLGPRTELIIEPGATVRLDASQSSDPDGDPITGYHWRIARVPPDFVLNLDADSPAPEVTLHQTGSYAFEVDLFNGEEETSCQPGRVEIEVSSDE